MRHSNDNGAVWSGNVLCLMVLLLFVVPIPAWSAPASSLEKPAAKVNETVLTEFDLQEALNEIMPAGVFHGGFSSEKRASYRPKAIEKMIEKELFCQEAVKRGFDFSHISSRRFSFSSLSVRNRISAAAEHCGKAAGVSLPVLQWDFGVFFPRPRLVSGSSFQCP